MAIVCAVLVLSVSAAPKKGPATKYVNATELTMLGKLCETTNPYHRVETESIPELTKTEARLLRQASGLVIAFKTNSRDIRNLRCRDSHISRKRIAVDLGGLRHIRLKVGTVERTYRMCR